MGSLGTKLLGQKAIEQPLGSCDCRKRKRSLECPCDSETDEETENLLNTPRRKKLKSTSKYIYQTLFLNGENSDIKICALDQEWSLHKIYLCQSGYFSSMFCGSWKESSMDVIELEIPDRNIDAEALQVAFGSLYRDEVLIKPSRVISILAAACMLQLDGLIQQCGETMKETISVQTVCGYSAAASIYGLDNVKKNLITLPKSNRLTIGAFSIHAQGWSEQTPRLQRFAIRPRRRVYLPRRKSLPEGPSAYEWTLRKLETTQLSYASKCLEWLLNNLMTHQSVDLFKELGINMMRQLISSHDLLVMQVEMDVYTTLKKWMFLQLVPSWNGSLKHLLTEADTWFSKRRKELEESGIGFLECEQGCPFVPVFRPLRLQYIISDLASARIIERDAIIPTEWLSSIYKQQWFTMLRAEQDNDTGPLEINKDELESNSMRCGRKLSKDGDYCWRWTGFNFGFDLLVTYTNRYIIFKRNTLNQPCSGSVSLQPTRNIAFRLRLASFDSNGKVICNRTSGYQILSLEKDQEQVVMNLDSRLLLFPLYICCNFLYTSPEKRMEAEGQMDNPEN